MFFDDVFHIIFDNVLLKDSVQISRYFINFTLSHTAQQTIVSLEHLALSILLFYFDHRLMKGLLIISGRKYAPRVFVWRPDRVFEKLEKK